MTKRTNYTPYSSFTTIRRWATDDKLREVSHTIKIALVIKVKAFYTLLLHLRYSGRRYTPYG